MIVLFCFSSSVTAIIYIPSLVFGSRKHDFIYCYLSKNQFLYHLYPFYWVLSIYTLAYWLFHFFKCVPHKAIILQGSFSRNCFREFTFDLIPFVLQYITLNSFIGVFLFFLASSCSLFIWSFYVIFIIVSTVFWISSYIVWLVTIWVSWSVVIWFAW